MKFTFCYKTTDGRTWGDFIDAPDWHTALDAVAELQGYQCGAVCAIIDDETGLVEFDAEQPDCPTYLRDHPAGRLTL